MSVWSSVEGEVWFSKEDHGCSIKTLINELYSETVVYVERINSRAYRVEFTYSLENEDAWGVVKNFISKLKEFDKNVAIDIEAKIRYLV